MYIKVDIIKACDRVKWSYILNCSTMGFSDCLLSWIHGCLSTASFQVLMNGEPGSSYTASNRVRQGDPLAPYLFLHGMEGLSRLLNRASSEGAIEHAMTQNGLPVSHILYVDDILIFVKDSKLMRRMPMRSVTSSKIFLKCLGYI